MRLQRRERLASSIVVTGTGSYRCTSADYRSVRTKMLKFHVHMASLNSPQCATCSERFPCLRLCSISTECVRCSHDKHSPKVYSAANSMDPGPIPPQLQIGSCIDIIHGTCIISMVHVHVRTACTRLSLEVLIAIMLMIQFGPCRD